MFIHTFCLYMGGMERVKDILLHEDDEDSLQSLRIKPLSLE